VAVEPLWGNPNSVLWGKAGDRRGSAKTRFAGRHRRPPILHYRTRQHPGYIGLRRGSARAAVLKHYHSMHSPIACWIRTRRSDLECASYRFFVATGARIAAAPVAHCPPLPTGQTMSSTRSGRQRQANRSARSADLGKGRRYRRVSRPSRASSGSSRGG